MRGMTARPKGFKPLSLAFISAGLPGHPGILPRRARAIRKRIQQIRITSRALWCGNGGGSGGIAGYMLTYECIYVSVFGLVCVWVFARVRRRTGE